MRRIANQMSVLFNPIGPAPGKVGRRRASAGGSLLRPSDHSAAGAVICDAFIVKGRRKFCFRRPFRLFWGERYAAIHAYDALAKYRAASVTRMSEEPIRMNQK